MIFVILAAGKGNRMKPLTDKIPKALVKVKGKSLLKRNLETVSELKPEKIIIVVEYKADMVKKKFSEKFRGIPLEFVDQTQLWGTGHAVIRVKKNVGEKDFIVLNVDVLTDAEDMQKVIQKKGFECVVLAKKAQKPENFGVLKTDGEKLLGIEEKPEKPESNLINAGVYKFSSGLFSELEKITLSKRREFELPDAVNRLAEKGKASFVESDKKFVHFSTEKDLENVQGL